MAELEGGKARVSLTLDGDDGDSSSMDDATVAEVALGADRSLAGHEWLGGAVGGAEELGRSEDWGPHNKQLQNCSLLLLGVLSYAPSFTGRDLQRRAFWRQRPWRLGIGWRFVVGRPQSRCSRHAVVAAPRPSSSRSRVVALRAPSYSMS